MTDAVKELVDMLSIAANEEGATIFDHTPEEIGLHVMENHAAILATLERAGEPVADFYYPIEMPLNADGQGPATVGKDAASMTYEVWDQFCDSHGRFDRLSDAIRRARQLNALPTLQRLGQEFEEGDGFAIGDPVEKFTGEAIWHGVIVASYLTSKGKRRYVVEVKPQGFQMIAVPSQLRLATNRGESE